MNELSAFLRPNIDKIANVKYAASPRIRGEDGKPIEWEIRCIGADEYGRIRSSCLKTVPLSGKKGQFTQQIDTYRFQAEVCARCTVFPDLGSAELQDSWGVASPHELLGRLLTPGEFDDYVTRVFTVNDFKAENDLVDEAKN